MPVITRECWLIIVAIILLHLRSLAIMYAINLFYALGICFLQIVLITLPAQIIVFVI